ncbi:putative protein phosphatase 2C 60 [Apostasia shenzhenica]|uniref:protein-serine/threonine phosphatase n=1 Tax=Apostasia shenzhenica TaxID=1088818 RepID=A0A2H9ZXY8_9ASPA|nr:putative protein phosphatase 2C 60 [Apostasia shenzhenica]
MGRSSPLMKIVRPCWKPNAGERTVDGSSRNAGGGRADGLLWYKDLGRHAAGEFSMAVVQANSLLEDGSQLESGPMGSCGAGSSPHGTFIGVYDGHGGPETARYIADNLFRNLKDIVSEEQEMSVDCIRRAFSTTEDGFISFVRKQWSISPQLASVGSCCLVGIICAGILYVANLGDSRAVLGRLDGEERGIAAVQMTAEHNASNESVRNELRSLHPHDSQIVVLKHKVWRVKGIIQISRSIGDAYLKDAEFNREPLLAKFRLPQPFGTSILSADPSIVTRRLCPQDQFIIFASDGLWEHLSNQEAVEIVHVYPRAGIARRLIKAALKEAAKKREMRYSDLKKIDRGIRRHFHDDISVIVVFLDPGLIGKYSSSDAPVVSLKGGVFPSHADATLSSGF